jgi:hypothetical protein
LITLSTYSERPDVTNLNGEVFLFMNGKGTGYAGGDPVNRNDPTGLFSCALDDPLCNPFGFDSDDDDDDGGETINYPCYAPNGFEPSPSPGCQGGGPPQPTQPTQPQPQCSITEFARGVPFAGSPASHTYLEIIDPYLRMDDILEGGPSNPHSPFSNMSWGNLLGIITGTLGATQPAPLKGDNPSTNTELGAESGSSVCSEVVQLFQSVELYDAGSKVSYAPLPNGRTTFNSNSFTYTLLSQIGLAGIFNQPFWAPGWKYTVPGL